MSQNCSNGKAKSPDYIGMEATSIGSLLAAKHHSSSTHSRRRYFWQYTILGGNTLQEVILAIKECVAKARSIVRKSMDGRTCGNI